MEGPSVFLIDQDLLPFEFKVYRSRTCRDTCRSIRTMMVRGAGAIGAAAGFAMAQAVLMAPKKGFVAYIKKAKKEIEATRPTARNLFYAVERVFAKSVNSSAPGEDATAEAQSIADEDADKCKKIGEFGSRLIRNDARIETHCNAGWLAFVDHGSALSPVYAARDQGKKVFVYVDETRPRGQGARLTAWELLNEKIPFAIVPDNAGAYLMSQGKVDIMLVGADRIAANGDVANKIGTLEKAIAAKEFNVPFYVAAPTSTFDARCRSGKDVVIEERAEEEVLYQTGLSGKGRLEKVLVSAPGSKAVNPAFDVTPARLITGIITEKGIIKASASAIKNLLKNI